MCDRELIKFVEKKRDNLYIKYKKAKLLKKLIKIYLDKYDNLLIELYTKYGNKITIKK